jgi:hypothetical protein
VDRIIFDADPDPTFHIAGDPGLTPSFTNGKNMKNFVDFWSHTAEPVYIVLYFSTASGDIIFNVLDSKLR